MKSKLTLFKKWKILFILFGILISADAYATHFRGGSINWRCINGGDDIEVTIVTHWRANFGSVGYVLNLGNGTSLVSTSGGGQLTQTFINVSENWKTMYQQEIIPAASITDGIVGFSACCRINTLPNGWGSDGFSLYTNVSAGCNYAPTISSPVFVNVAPGNVQTCFQLIANDAQGDAFTYEIANTTDSGLNPSPDTQWPSGTLSSSGLLCVNPTTAPGAPGGGYSNGQLIPFPYKVTDSNGNYNMGDVLIRVNSAVNGVAPDWDYTVTPADGSTINMFAGVAGSINLRATDGDVGNTIDLLPSGVPGTASFSPALPNTSNPNVTTLNWTPTAADAGTYPVTIIAQDNIGMQASTSFFINVQACGAPVAVCQDVTLGLDGNGELTVTAADIDNGSTADCGMGSMTVTNAGPFSCEDIGTQVVTLVVTDINGDSDQCTASVYVEDNTPPDPVCDQSEITVLSPVTGTVLISAEILNDGSFDNCTAAADLEYAFDEDFTILDSLMDCDNVGLYTYDIWVRDEAGNVSASCPAQLEVIDNTAPTCMTQDMSVTLNHHGMASITVADVDDGTWDHCGIDTVYLSRYDFTCDDVIYDEVTNTFSPVQIDLIATDNNGNVATCQVNITVQDLGHIHVHCQDVTLSLDANNEVTLDPVSLVMPGSLYDNCGFHPTDSLSVSQSNFTCNDLGTSTVTLTIRDKHGNVETCTSQVTILDENDPIAECKAFTLELDATGSATLAAEDIDDGSYDECGQPVTLSAGQTAFDCSHLGANTVTLTVTDASGNDAQCDATVTVVDNVDPVAVCQDITIELNASGSASIVAADIDGGSTDNCGSVSLSIEDGTFGCANLGANTVTLTADDGNGNTHTCDATVTVVDHVAPTVSCQAANIILDASGNASVAQSDVYAGSSDNCNVTVIDYGPTSVGCEGIDMSGYTLLGDYNGKRYYQSNAAMSWDAALNDAIAHGGMLASIEDAAENAFIAGLISERSWIGYTDRVAEGDFVWVDGSLSTYTNWDGGEPNNLGGEDYTEIFDGSGLWNDLPNGGLPNTYVMETLIPGDNQVSATVYVEDQSGNSAACMSLITVIDNTDPTAVCQNVTVQLDMDGNGSITTAQIDNGSSDACGIDTMYLDVYDFDCSNVGSNNVTLTVVDVNGNISTCLANAEVIDEVNPECLSQNITVSLDEFSAPGGNVTINATDIDNGSNDACGIASYEVRRESGGTFASSVNLNCLDVNASPILLELRVTDVNGNTSICTAEVTVLDGTSPFMNCQDEITVPLNSDGNGAVIGINLLGWFGIYDACGIDQVLVDGLPVRYFDCDDLFNDDLMVTVSAYDNHGNVTECMVSIVVEDKEDPECEAQDITVQLDDNGMASIVAADIDNGSTDNCGIVSWTLDRYDFTCADVGEVTVTLTVEDESGNTSQCNATVTVEDMVAPIVECTDVTVYLEQSDGAPGQVRVTPGELLANSVQIHSSNLSPYGNGTGGSGVTDYVVTVSSAVTLEFMWYYASNNSSPTYDRFGYTVNGVLTQLSDDAGLLTQSGTASISLNAGDTFGLQMNATDNAFGRAHGSVVGLDLTGDLAAANWSVSNTNSDGYASINDSGLMVSDACGIASIEIDEDFFDCGDYGTSTPVTVTVTDVNGQVATCVSNVYVDDIQAPNAQCQSVTVQLDASGNASIAEDAVDGGSTDGCTVTSYDTDITDFTCSDIGANTVVLTVTDQAGNTATCEATVTVEDNVAPTAMCANVTLQLDASGQVTLDPAMLDGGSTDACEIDSTAYVASQTMFDCDDIGVQTVTLTVYDKNGNSDQCDAQVTIEDMVAPVVECTDVTVYLEQSEFNPGQVRVSPGELLANSVQIHSSNLSPYGNGIGGSGVTDYVVTVSSAMTLEFMWYYASNNSNPTYDKFGYTVNGVLTQLSDDAGLLTQSGTASISLNAGDTFGLQMNATDNAFGRAHGSVVGLDLTGDLAAANWSVSNTNSDGYASINDSGLMVSDACGIASIEIDEDYFDCGDYGTSTPVTVTVTDVNGQVATCVSNVYVDDIQAPNAQCQNITVQLDASGNASIAEDAVDGGSIDGCSIVSYDTDITDFTCDDIGANSVVLTVTDQAGNTATCEATVTVEDNVAPTAVCQDITVYLDFAGNATIEASDIDGGSYDNCALALDPFSVDISSFDCANTAAPVAVELTVTDASGNASNCVAHVTVIDDVKPMVNCVNNVEVPLNGDGRGFVTKEEVLSAAFDACGIMDTVIIGDGQMGDTLYFNCADIGLVPVTIRVTDNNGNVEECNTEVNVKDEIAPVISCISMPTTIYLDANGEAVLDPVDLDDGTTDNCGPITFTASKTDYTCADFGINNVTLYATDGQGNPSSCNAMVIVADNIDPVASCQNITVQLDASGNASITAADLDAGSTDNCSVVSMSVDNDQFDCTMIGANTVTLTVTDQAGNTDSCPATVTVEDMVAPIVECTDATVYLEQSDGAPGQVRVTPGELLANSVQIHSSNLSPYGNGAGGSGVTDYVVTVSSAVTLEFMWYYASNNSSPTYDRFGYTVNGVLTQLSDDAGLLTQSGTASISLNAGDTFGLQMNATDNAFGRAHGSVVGLDLTGDLAAANWSVSNTNADGYASINDSGLMVSDACGIASIEIDEDFFDCGDYGTSTPVTVTVTDVNGQVATCVSNVYVDDIQAPNAQCQSVTVQLDASGNASIAEDAVDGGSTDGCTVTSYDTDITDFTCSDIGANTVVLTVTDQAGNTATCEATVTVNDNTAPVAVCQAVTLQLDANGVVVLDPADLDGGSTDACGIDVTAYAASQTEFDCTHIGTNTVTLTVYDNNGNSSTCDATVTVEDNVLPIAECSAYTVQLDATGNASIVAADVDGGSSDNCGIASMSVSPSDFTCSDIGANTVTLTVMDAEGNTATCTTTVTVEDNIAPTATCQAYTLALDATGNATLLPENVDDGSNDACGIASMTVSPNTFDCSHIGANTVTLTVEDSNGNTSTCSATVTVEDVTGPEITCPDNIEKFTLPSDCNQNVIMPPLAPSDVCTGSATYEYQAVGITFINTGVDVFALFPVGLTEVTAIATDGYNNTSTCSFFVEVIDNIDPVVTGCADIGDMTVPSDAGTCGAVVTWDESLINANDNCSGLGDGLDLSSNYTSGDEFPVGTTTVTYTATDEAGNTSECSFDVTVLPADGVASYTYIDASLEVQFTDASDNAASWSWDFGDGNSSTEQSPNYTYAADGTYTVCLTITDVCGATDTYCEDITLVDSGNMGIDQMVLMPGWNLISFDVDPMDSTIPSVFDGHLNGDIGLISGFENAALFYDPALPPMLNSLVEVKPGYGYWVFANNEFTLSTSGAEIDPSYKRDLDQGWNLISYSPDVPMAPNMYFSDLESMGALEYASGYNPDDGIMTYDPSLPAIPGLQSLGTLENGYGYWVKTNQAVNGTWINGDDQTEVRDDHTDEWGNKITSSYDFILGKVQGVSIGEMIDIINEDREVVAQLEVIQDNYLMTLPIYGDDASTEELDGLVAGQELSFSYNGAVSDLTVSFDGNRNVNFVELDFRLVDVETPELENEAVTMYPNPFVDEATITIVAQTSANFNMKVLNAAGAVVLDRDLGRLAQGTNEFILEKGDLPTGQYHVLVHNKDTNNVTRLKAIIVQ